MAVGRRARMALVGVLACAAPGLAGCGGSGYDYVSNRDAGLYFKVPDGWTVLEVTDQDSGIPETIGQTDSWLRLLDRSPDPGAVNFNADLPLYPVGIASVGPISSFEDRDQLNYATLRAMATNGVDDPLDLASAPNPDVQIIDLEDVTTDDGVRGERIVFTLTQPDGALLTVDQTAMVDPQTTEVYRLLLKCEAHCYEANRDEIDDIVDSWTIDQEG